MLYIVYQWLLARSPQVFFWSDVLLLKLMFALTLFKKIKCPWAADLLTVSPWAEKNLILCLFLQCAPGYYSETTGQSTCEVCPAGSRCPLRDSSPVQCVFGQVCTMFYLSGYFHALFAAVIIIILVLHLLDFSSSLSMPLFLIAPPLICWLEEFSHTTVSSSVRLITTALSLL